MGVILAVVSVAAFVVAAYFAEKKGLRRALAGAAAVAVLAAFVVSWVRGGRAPAGFYGMGLLFSFACACAAALAEIPVARYASVAGALALVAWAALVRTPQESDCAGLLFVPHAASFMAGYALLFAAAVCAAAPWFRKYRSREREFVRNARSVSRLAFLFLAIGTVAGAFAARAAWGEYWTWNAKEAAIFAPLALLAASRAVGIRTSAGRKLILAAAAGAAISFFAVGLFPASRTSPHPALRTKPAARRGST